MTKFKVGDKVKCIDAVGTYGEIKVGSISFISDNEARNSMLWKACSGALTTIRVDKPS